MDLLREMDVDPDTRACIVHLIDMARTDRRCVDPARRFLALARQGIAA